LYALVPSAIALVLIIGLSVLGIWGTLRADTALFGEATGFWAQLGSWLFIVCMSAVAVVTAIIVTLCLAQPLSGFALEKIVYAQERVLIGESTPAPPLLGSMLRSGWVSLVPGVVLLFLPMGVAGATRLAVAAEETGDRI